jgi:hypothetical protein
MSGLLDLPLTGLVESVGKTITTLVTTDKERMAAELADKQEDNKLVLGQQDINRVEAASASLLVAGWRPAVGWTCVMGLWMAFVPKAFVITMLWTWTAWRVVAAWNGAAMPVLPTFPDLGLTDLIGLLTALLGMAGMRHRETMNGVARTEPLTPFRLPWSGKRAESAPQQEEAP